MAKKRTQANPFTGRWRITSMSQWDQDFIDEEEEGYIKFDKDDGGEFHFGYVHGQMDCRLTKNDGEPSIDWSWEGNDEMTPVAGRGWATIEGDEITGMIFFHQGDESEFKAKKSERK